MRIYAERLKKLYDINRINTAALQNALKLNLIDQTEYDEIVND